MKVSIITVSYNSAKTIQKTFDSVRRQIYNDIEYIVIDGNSKDDTVSLIKNNLDIIDHWVSEPDKGLYDAMNKGVSMATGDIIGILNSDDTFFNSEVVKDVARFHIDNNIEASIGNIVQHNADGKIIRKYNSKNWNPEKLRVGFMPPHPSIFFKNTLFPKFGFYREDLNISADYELITRFFLKYKIKWKYSSITTTAMLIGGVSSSGYSSYKMITEQLFKALKFNDVEFSKWKVRLRFIWKLKELF